jgi:hypothetical protein
VELLELIGKPTQFARIDNGLRHDWHSGRRCLLALLPTERPEAIPPGKNQPAPKLGTGCFDAQSMKLVPLRFVLLLARGFGFGGVIPFELV